MHSFNWFDRRGTEGVGFVRALRTLLTNNIPQILPNLSILITSSLTDMLAEHPIVDGMRSWLGPVETLRLAVAKSILFQGLATLLSTM
jgi:hypothetical protein